MRASGFLNKLVSSAKGKVREAGNKFASVLLKFFLQPIGKIGSELGHIMGSVVGTVLFEVVFALVTWVWERQFLLLRAL